MFRTHCCREDINVEEMSAVEYTSAVEGMPSLEAMLAVEEVDTYAFVAQFSHGCSSITLKASSQALSILSLYCLLVS
jgi:hypothetical protein